MKGLCFFFLLLVNTTLLAEVKSATPEKTTIQQILNSRQSIDNFTPTEQKTLAFIQKLYEWFNDIGNPNYQLDSNAITKFLDPNCIININGTEAAKGTSGILQYITQYRLLKQMTIADLPFKEIVFSKDGKKIFLEYKATFGTGDIQLGGFKQSLEVMVLLTLNKEGLIEQIDEVFSPVSMPAQPMPNMPDMSKFKMPNRPEIPNLLDMPNNPEIPANEPSNRYERSARPTIGQ